MNLLQTLARWAGLDSDTPQPFGYKQAWLAISANNSETVAHALGMRHARPCTWAKGTQPNQEGLLFITPTIRGWIFVVGLDDVAGDEQIDTRITQLIEPLSGAGASPPAISAQPMAPPRAGCWGRGIAPPAGKRT